MFCFLAERIVPVIQSVGPPPERHAERVVCDMIDYLHAEKGRVWERTTGVIDMRKMGNPVAQRRTFQRLMNLAGPNLFSIHLAPGKRGRFKASVQDWTLWDPDTGTIVDSGPLPANPQIACVNNTLIGKGDSMDSPWSAHLIISKHAAVRLAERCGVRDPADLLGAIGVVWSFVPHLIRAMRDGGEWLRPPPGGWRVPVSNSNGEVLGVAVLEQHEDGRRLVVKTVLEPFMVDNLADVEALVGAKPDAAMFRKAAHASTLLPE